MKETWNNGDSCNLEKRLTNIKIKSTPVSSVAGEKFDWEKVTRQRKLRIYNMHKYLKMPNIYL